MGTHAAFVLIGLIVILHVRGSPADVVSKEAVVKKQPSAQSGAQNAQVPDSAGQTVAAGASSDQKAANDSATGPGATDQDGSAEGGTAEDDDGLEDDEGDVQENEEEEEVEGMSPSLADYVLGLLTPSNATSSNGQGNTAAPAASDQNATQPQGSAHAPPTKGVAVDLTPGNATAATSQGESPGSPSAEEGTSNTADHTYWDDDDDDEFDDDVDFWGDDQWDSTEDFATPGPVDCSAKVDLQDYCPFLTTEEKDFFRGNMSVGGLRAPFIDIDIVRSLMSCPRGEWCLDDRLSVFRGMQDGFYRSPLCSDTIWKCIFGVMVLRQNCTHDEEFLFVVDALDLVCSLDVAAVEPVRLSQQESTCFTYVLAALHVTYADFLANGMTTPPAEDDGLCQGAGFRMTKTYLCVDNHCKGQYDSRLAMEEFRRWSWFMVYTGQTVEACPLDDVCGPLNGTAAKTPAPAPTPTPSWIGMLTSTPVWVSTARPPSTARPEGGKMFGETDKSTIIALMVASALGLLFMVLGLLFFWRRTRRRTAYYYKTVSEGYDKVPNDEAHLLGHSTD